MCCSGTAPMNHCHGHVVRVHHSHGHSGCGCHGGGHPAVKLETYKAYLEAELKSVEDRLGGQTED